MPRHSLTLASLVGAAALAACAPKPPPVVAKAPPPPVEDSVHVPFHSASATLDRKADKALDHAARLFREGKPVVMFVTGHADAKGNELSNLYLSARRAESVKKALVARGLPADQLQVQAVGESSPLDSANPDAGDNRDVVITWK